MSDQIGSRRFTTTERVKIGLIVCRDISPFFRCHFSWINMTAYFVIRQQILVYPFICQDLIVNFPLWPLHISL